MNKTIADKVMHEISVGVRTKLDKLRLQSNNVDHIPAAIRVYEDFIEELRELHQVYKMENNLQKGTA